MKKQLYGTSFCGTEASSYGKQYGYLDYAAFARPFDCVLNNSIMSELEGKGYYFEPIIDGTYYTDSEGNEVDYEYYEDHYEECYEEFPEVYQTFIVSDNFADKIKEFEVGLLWYNEDLNLYIWGVTHWGTSWDYVLTDIKLNCGEEAFK